MKYRVIKPHRSEFPEPLQAGKGDCLRYERRPTPWQGWLYCVSAGGVSGWVPEDWTRIESETVCRMLRDYVARELDVDAGETFESELQESGWAWGRSSRGDTGWLPLEVLAPL
jgi:hypothetical protein